MLPQIPKQIQEKTKQKLYSQRFCSGQVRPDRESLHASALGQPEYPMIWHWNVLDTLGRERDTLESVQEAAESVHQVLESVLDALKRVRGEHRVVDAPESVVQGFLGDVQTLLLWNVQTRSGAGPTRRFCIGKRPPVPRLIESRRRGHDASGLS